MSELTAFADFVVKYGWLGVTILIMGAWTFGIFHSDREVKALDAEHAKALVERDKKFDDMKQDRDKWEQRAGESIHALEQLTSAMRPASEVRR